LDPIIKDLREGNVMIPSLPPIESRGAYRGRPVVVQRRDDVGSPGEGTVGISRQRPVATPPLADDVHVRRALLAVRLWDEKKIKDRSEVSTVAASLDHPKFIMACRRFRGLIPE
jgi:hypothetical protein